MTNPKKKIINSELIEVSPYEFEGTLDALKAQVDEWINNYGVDARVEWDPDNWPQYTDSPSPRFKITKDREETNEEFDKRVKDESLRISLQDERDRKEFERLQSKFGKK